MSASGKLAAGLEIARSGEEVHMTDLTVQEAYQEHRLNYPSLSAFIVHIEQRWRVIFKRSGDHWNVFRQAFSPPPEPTVSVINSRGENEERQIDSIERSTGLITPELKEGEGFFRTVDGRIHIIEGL